MYLALQGVNEQVIAGRIFLCDNTADNRRWSVCRVVVNRFAEADDAPCSELPMLQLYVISVKASEPKNRFHLFRKQIGIPTYTCGQPHASDRFETG